MNSNLNPAPLAPPVLRTASSAAIRFPFPTRPAHDAGTVHPGPTYLLNTHTFQSGAFARESVATFETPRA